MSFDWVVRDRTRHLPNIKYIGLDSIFFFQPTMAVWWEEIDLVTDILRWTFQDKLDIMRKDRPTPKLASLSQLGKSLSATFKSVTTSSILAHSLWGSLQSEFLGVAVICNWSNWCLEQYWVCKLELSNQGSRARARYQGKKSELKLMPETRLNTLDFEH